MTVTRRIHVVRIKNPNDKGNTYVDVAVLDAIGIRTASGDEALFEVMAFSGDQDDASAASSGAEERVYDMPAANAAPLIVDSTGDGSAKGDPKDAGAKFSRKSHMKRLTNKTNPNQFIDVEILDAVALKGPNGSEVALIMPQGTSKAMVLDATGSQLNVPAGPDTTRALHVIKLKSGDPKIPGSGDPKKFLLVERTDKIAFKGPNGHEFLLTAPNDDDASANDTTNYSLDDDGNATVPPDNTDPNPYVVFPPDSQGPFLGADVPTNQGLLWWIKATNFVHGVWYWYIPKQQPMDFSFFGKPPEGVTFDPDFGLGFQLLPYFPMIWILSQNSDPVPIPQIGFTSLEDAIKKGSPDFSGFAAKALPNGAGPSGDFGVIPFTAPQVPTASIPFTVPNIWQLTGIKQPFDLNGVPAKPKDSLAAQVANQFLTYWNEVTDAANAEIAGWIGPDLNRNFGGQYTYPPAWPWVVPQPWFSNFAGIQYAGNFQAGLPTALFNIGIPLEVLPVATSTRIAIGQLDPGVWNTDVFPPTPLF